MRRFHFSVAFALALAVISLFPRSAFADDIFAVSGIHVDASGPSASVAQGTAMAQGRPKAWAILYKRVTKQQDWGRQPNLDDAMLQRIIRTFTVKNEKRSTTRYVADVTYTFSPEGVGRVLQSGGIAYTQLQVKRILLIPMAPNFSSTSLWTAAFSGTRYSGSAVPFALPGGGDQTTLGALTFDSVNWIDVEPIASRIHSAEAVVVQVVPSADHLTINLKRLGAGQLPSKTTFDVPLQKGGAAGTYSMAADAAVHGVEEMWKTPASFGTPGKLIADVRISSLAQFGALQAQLTSVANVTGISVVAMDIGEARISVAYLGGPDALKDALAAKGVYLTKSGGEWALSTSGTP
ncbi:MAG TPA: hypothetical protein VMF58_07855 [Rhizomicrobium sp.]|nr:hypothetical protein [Rhizomicrobium sp.]